MRFFHIFFITFFIIDCSSNLAQTRSRILPLKRFATADHTTLIAPQNYKPEKPNSKVFNTKDLDVYLYARQFVHGDIIYLELIPKNAISDLEIFVDQKKILITKHQWGYRGFFAIHPEMEQKNVAIKTSFKKDFFPMSEEISFPLDKKVFPIGRGSLDLGNYSRTDIVSQKEIQERIQHEIREKQRIYTELDPNHIGNTISHPRDFHALNSPFYIKRIYDQFEMINGKKIIHEPKISYHRGLDFLANVGDRVYSMAGGKISLAKELYFEGNCVFIDHGNKILTIYMHLSKLNVHEGQYVKAAHLIGFAGSTGISTGAHLHVSMFVDSVPVDPLSLIYLPVRN